MRSLILKISGLLIILISISAFSHKFYVSISQIDVNKKDEVLEISIRLFADDLEEAIKKETGKILLLGSYNQNPDSEKLIVSYLKNNFIVKQKEAKINFKFIGYEMEKDIIWIYLENPFDPEIEKLHISNTLIISLYEDQKNIINLINSENTKSQICTKTNPAYQFHLGSS